MSFKVYNIFGNYITEKTLFYIAENGIVNSIIAGNNISILPPDGRGIVEINSNGSGLPHGNYYGDSIYFNGTDWVSAGASSTENINIGNSAGEISTGNFNIALGNTAGGSQYGGNNVAISKNSGGIQSGYDIAIGYTAGSSQTGAYNVALGASAGYNQSGYDVAIGPSAGTNQTNGSNIALGNNAGISQSGSDISIGVSSGNSQTGYTNVAIGASAGYSQSGSDTAVGPSAGQTQTGSSNLALGNTAGNSQSGSAIAIGSFSGGLSQDTNSIYIGSLNSASPLNQGANSIVINASGTEILSATGSNLYITPIQGAAIPSPVTYLFYDSTTGLVQYNTTAKTFIVDHPDNVDKYLIHACLEGPESGVYYRGSSSITNNESVIVNLPSYVKNLAFDFTVQITPIYSGKCVVYNVSEVMHNRFTVYGENGKFFWHVHASRGNIEVEPNKDEVNI